MSLDRPDQIISFLLGQREIEIINLQAENKRLKKVLNFIEANLDESLATVLVKNKMMSEESFRTRFGGKDNS